MVLSEVEVIAGPSPIAYSLVGGVLRIWVGSQASGAPSEAIQTAIADGCTSWGMRDTAHAEMVTTYAPEPVIEG